MSEKNSKKSLQLPRGIRNNNPLNIRRGSSWAGLRPEQTDRAFCQFVSMVYGWRAAFMLMRSYYYKYNLRTVRAIISRWAPPEDGNDTGQYINIVCQGMTSIVGHELNPDDPLPDPDLYPLYWGKMLSTMAFVENGPKIGDYSTFDEIVVGWHLMELAAGPKRVITP